MYYNERPHWEKKDNLGLKKEGETQLKMVNSYNTSILLFIYFLNPSILFND